jgi:arylsulfatase A-like enzyme
MSDEVKGLNRRQALKGGLSLGAMAAAAFGAGKTLAWTKRRDNRPNMIVIMGDDIGYSDLGAYGGDTDTPNLDALAGRSVRFNNFYNMSRCCPSRASLLTGRYPHRVNMTGNGTSLSLDTPTVAEQLRASGYATTMVGKWHLTAAEPLTPPAEHLKWLNHQGHFDRDFGDKRTYPAARGFDYHWGIIWGVCDYYDPFSLVENFTPVREVPKDFYLTNAISDHAVEQVTKLGKGDKPFMMYLAYTAAHWPLMAPENVIQKYLPRFEDGWDAMRQRRYERQVKMGLVDPKTNPLPPLDDDYAANAKTEWDALTPEHRAEQVRKMATHAAMIDVMDQGIGRVVQALKDSGAYDNTVVMFLIDNGASPEIMTRAGYDRPSETRDGREVGYGEYPGGIGTELNQTGIGAHWASAANTPFHWWKAESYQGGTHTPFMISWPAGMKGREGKAVDQGAHIIDVTPTLLELAGVTPSQKGSPMDGKSFAGALTGKPLPKIRPFFFEHYGARAVIDGEWKLVSLAPRGKVHAYRQWALYDLATDRTETKDIAAAHPDIVDRLAKEWLGWADSVGLKLRAEMGAGGGAPEKEENFSD